LLLHKALDSKKPKSKSKQKLKKKKKVEAREEELELIVNLLNYFYRMLENHGRTHNKKSNFISIKF